LPSILCTAVCGRPSTATSDTAATLKLLRLLIYQQK
jgi:hypothetical protein